MKEPESLLQARPHCGCGAFAGYDGNCRNCRPVRPCNEWVSGPYGFEPPHCSPVTMPDGSYACCYDVEDAA